MNENQKIMIAGLIIVSIILFLVPLFVFLVKSKRFESKSKKSEIGTMLLFSSFLILSLWFLRYSIGYYKIITGVSANNISWVEEILNSFFQTLRTFGVEENYSNIVHNLKLMMSDIVKEGSVFLKPLQSLLVFYTSILLTAAPIAGGAIIFEILAKIFPKIKMRFYYCIFWRKKYFFSELNEASLSLAKSLYYEEKEKKPIFIFTDTYIDDKNEKEYELLLEAKKYGAICIHDDLIHIAKTTLGTSAYYLMDKNELGNLKTLLGLVDDHNVKFIGNSTIYLFVQSDAYVQMEKQVYSMLEEDKKKKLLKKRKNPTIIPIFPYRNLVHNLMSEIPLYEPLVNKKDKSKLNITILGNGIIGTEAFLSAYWFGQILISNETDGRKTLSECEMTINVVSKESEEEFWAKIDYINPEIKETVKIRRNDEWYNNSDLLNYDSEGNKNNPYCNVRYVQADVKCSCFTNGESEDIQSVLEADYFVVALGDDADNISVADKLRYQIGKKHLEKADSADINNVVIAYAVFNSELANILNSKKHYQCVVPNKTDVFMYAFGSLQQVYSYDNIHMSKSELLARGTGEAYDRTRMLENQITDNETRKKNERKNYTYWADFARAMHIKYKVFSLGLINKSVFDYQEDSSDYDSYIKGRCDLYKKAALAKTEQEAKKYIEDICSKREILAWLEHRRWSAFTRTMGYRLTREFKKNFQLNGIDGKNMELKLHPCLLEVKKPMLDSENTYMHKALAKIFEESTLKIKEEDFEKKDIAIDLLKKRKQTLELREQKLLAEKGIDFMFLDKLTYEWCEVATKASIIMLDEAIKKLQASATMKKKEIKEISINAWNGIFSYDFKMYDYMTYDF